MQPVIVGFLGENLGSLAAGKMCSGTNEKASPIFHWRSGFQRFNNRAHTGVSYRPAATLAWWFGRTPGKLSSPKTRVTRNFSMRKASAKDAKKLVDLMDQFYRESAYTLNRQRAAAAFAAILSDERLGHIWLIESDSEEVGYLVVTLGFSMEYGGPCAFIDDFFIQGTFRGQGLGTAALIDAKLFCERIGVRAIHVETGRDNAAAQAVYRRIGFGETDRQLLTLKLADPTHAP
jgi:GNAT superfamily N-acetyltransferase